jgi:bifunctional non-homologous end joining protein LigD
MARDAGRGSAVEPRAPQGAVPAELPGALEPELATLVQKPPTAGSWLYEIKFDGYRMLARVAGSGDVRLITRRNNDWTARFPALQAELIASGLPTGWYDGEIAMLDTNGLPSFNALQNAIDSGHNERIVFFLFDAPYMNGWDLRRVPVEERRALLREALKPTGRLRYSEEIEADANDMLASACKLGLEGVIGKRRGSPYVHRRSDDWIKLKCVNREEFVIGGYTWPDESRRDRGIGALLVGQFDAAGSLQYAGKVGTGYTGEVSTMLRRRLDAIAQSKRPFAGSTGHDRHATWVAPQLVAEVAYNERPAGGSLRHASFKELREDKPAPEVSQEARAPDHSRVAPPSAARSSTRRGAIVQPRQIKITHANRVIDSASGRTKGDLVRYYAEVAPWALPHLARRPVYVARFPEGIAGVRIFQQHPEGVKGFRGTDPALWPDHEPAISIETPEDLAHAAQMDTVEFHTWNSTAEAILLPDRIIFDLDPGQGVEWPQVREAALLMRAMLDELGLESWLKTTGGKGLHVVVPIRPEYDYPTVKGFSERLVKHMARAVPQRFVAKSGGSNRVGRIFIDYLRNGQSQSTAAAFSARARPGLPVSMPIGWDELAAVESGAHWTISSALERLRRQKKDPWARYWRAKQSLKPALQMLN